MTQQERWEENEGYSPSTLASNIAALFCAADLQNQLGRCRNRTVSARICRLSRVRTRTWCVTTQGSLLPGIMQYYIRILPTQVKSDARTAILRCQRIPTPQPSLSRISLKEGRSRPATLSMAAFRNSSASAFVRRRTLSSKIPSGSLMPSSRTTYRRSLLSSLQPRRLRPRRPGPAFWFARRRPALAFAHGGTRPLRIRRRTRR